MSDANNWITSCVSCGGPIEVKNKIRQYHECPKAHEAALRAANRRAYDDHDAIISRDGSYGPTVSDRLHVGFELLREDDNEE